MSDGEEGNTSDHSNSPDELGPRLEGELGPRLEDELGPRLEDMLSQTPEIPIDICSQSDGLSDKECAVRRVKTQMSLGKLCAEEHSCEVSPAACLSFVLLRGKGRCCGKEPGVQNAGGSVVAARQQSNSATLSLCCLPLGAGKGKQQSQS